MEKENKYQELKRLCEQKNTSISRVCRELNIPFTTVKGWDRNTPKPFVYEQKIKSFLNA